MPAASASTPNRNTTPTPLAVSVPVNGATVSPIFRFCESGLTSKLYSTGGTGTTRSHCTVTTVSAAPASARSARRSGKPRRPARPPSGFTNPAATRQPLARAGHRAPALTPSGFRRYREEAMLSPPAIMCPGWGTRNDRDHPYRRVIGHGNVNGGNCLRLRRLGGQRLQQLPQL